MLAMENNKEKTMKIIKKCFRGLKSSREGTEFNSFLLKKESEKDFFSHLYLLFVITTKILRYIYDINILSS